MISHRHAYRADGLPFSYFETFEVLEDGRLVAMIQCQLPFRGIGAALRRERCGWLVWRAPAAPGRCEREDYLGKVEAPNPPQASRLAAQMVRDAEAGRITHD